MRASSYLLLLIAGLFFLFQMAGFKVMPPVSSLISLVAMLAFAAYFKVSARSTESRVGENRGGGFFNVLLPLGLAFSTMNLVVAFSSISLVDGLNGTLIWAWSPMVVGVSAYIVFQNSSKQETLSLAGVKWFGVVLALVMKGLVALSGNRGVFLNGSAFLCIGALSLAAVLGNFGPRTVGKGFGVLFQGETGVDDIREAAGMFSFLERTVVASGLAGAGIGVVMVLKTWGVPSDLGPGLSLILLSVLYAYGLAVTFRLMGMTCQSRSNGALLQFDAMLPVSSLAVCPLFVFVILAVQLHLA